MSRPSQNLDEKLLKAGRDLIMEEGLSGLNLRAVAKRAGVNLGMFHYHFRNKEEFAARCTGEAYAEFYRGFQLETDGASGTIEKLRRGLMALARYSRDNRHFMLSLLRDLEDRNPGSWAFVRSKFPPPHGKVIAGLVKQGQKEGLLVKVAVPTAMMVLMSAIAFPNLLAGLGERALGTKLLGVPRFDLRKLFLSDQVLRDRVELALRGLLSQPEKTLRRSK